MWNWRVDQLPKREEELELQKLIHTPVFVPFNVKKRHFRDLFKILLSCVAFGFRGVAICTCSSVKRLSVPLDQKREYVFPACAPIPIPNTSSPHCVEDNNRTHGPAARDVGDESTVAGRPRSLSPRQGRRRCGVVARRIVRGSCRTRGRGGAWGETARVRGHDGRGGSSPPRTTRRRGGGRGRRRCGRGRGAGDGSPRKGSRRCGGRGADATASSGDLAARQAAEGRGGRRRGSAATQDGRGESSPPRTMRRRGGCRGRRRCGRGRGEGWGRWRGHAAADAAADEAARRRRRSSACAEAGRGGGGGEGPRPRGTAAEGCRLRGRRDSAGRCVSAQNVQSSCGNTGVIAVFCP